MKYTSEKRVVGFRKRNFQYDLYQHCKRRLPPSEIPSTPSIMHNPKWPVRESVKEKVQGH